VDAIVRYAPPENKTFNSDSGLLTNFYDWAILKTIFDAGFKLALQIQGLDVKVYSEAAITTGYVAGKMTPPGEDDRDIRWRVSIFWTKGEGGWNAVHAHYSPLTRVLISIPAKNREKFDEAHKRLAKPYALDESHEVMESAYPSQFSVSAGLISSVIDLAKYDIAIDQNMFLSRETQERVFTPTLSNKGETLPYGLGWFVQNYKGLKFVWHSGLWTCNSALILKVPEQNMTFIVLANTDKLSRPFPLEGDVMDSIMALAFLKTFIFPQKYNESLPEINWNAEESELIDQLKQVAGKDYRDIYAKELAANAMMLESIGATEAAERLRKIEDIFLSH
jgi:hypothetical protein